MALKKVLAKDLPNFLSGFYKDLKDVDSRKEFLTSYGYVLDMQENLNVILESDEFLNFFKNGKFLSKKEINKYLFSKIKKEDTEQTKKESLLVLSNDAIKILDSVESTNLQKIKKKITDKQRELSNYLNYVESISTELGRARMEYEKFKLSSLKYSNIFKEEFEKIIDSNLFAEVYFDETAKLFCVITKDVEFDWSGNHYNFGQYLITLNPINSEIRCWPYFNNFTSGAHYDYIHPHVFWDKKICYGTATAAISDNITHMSYHNVFNLIYLILNAYNENSPTLKIHFFDIKMTKEFYLREYWGAHPAKKAYPYELLKIKTSIYDHLNIENTVPYTSLLTLDKKEVA